jgi:formylglycine-generating enzyme required for sulfatase activity
VGGDLPSEAQLEFVASGRGREWGYAWGNDEPTCGDAVWGRGRGGGLGSAASNADDTCLQPADLGGVLGAGSGARDRLTLVDQTTQTSLEVLDLAGNVAEWAVDSWNRLSEPFWASPGVLTDPVATQASAVDPDLLYVVRAGNWTNVPYQLRAGYREGSPEAVSYGVGFRCAYPAK